MADLTEAQMAESQKNAEKEFAKIENTISKFSTTNMAKNVGLCVLDRDNHLGANAGSDASIVANYFNEMAGAGFRDGGTEALVARTLKNGPQQPQLENCAPGAVAMGGMQLPARGMGAS